MNPGLKLKKEAHTAMYSHRVCALPLLNIYHLILVLRGNSPLLLFDDYVLSKSVMHATIILQ
jgi:hypothetical protein